MSRKPKAPPGSGAKGNTEQPVPTKIAEADDDGNDFFSLAASGKVRPRVREPEKTHYECGCCRWW
jgi:hypothetical protein